MMKMDTVNSFKMLVNTSNITQHTNPGVQPLNLQYHENLSFKNIKKYRFSLLHHQFQYDIY
jgi:hypothetical protein